jgi:acyl carrier protein
MERKIAMNRAEMFEIVKSVMYEVVRDLKGHEIQMTDRWDDLGIDSIDIVEVGSESMKRLQIKVPWNQLGTARDLNTLLDLFEQAYAQQHLVNQADQA